MKKQIRNILIFINVFYFLVIFSVDKLKFNDQNFNFINNSPDKTKIIVNELALNKVSLNEGTSYAPISGNISILGEFDIFFEIHHYPYDFFKKEKKSMFSMHVEANEIKDIKIKYSYKKNIFVLAKEFFLKDMDNSYSCLKKILTLSLDINKYTEYFEKTKKSELLLIQDLYPENNEEINTDDDLLEDKIKKLKSIKKFIINNDDRVNLEVIYLIKYLLSK